MRTSAVAPRRTLDRRIVGTPSEVAAKVAILRDSNRLVAMSVPRQMANGDTRVWVTVRFIDRTQPAPVTRRQRRRWPAVAAGSVGVTALGVTGYALVQLVDAVIAAFPFIVGGLLLLALAALLTGGRSRTFSGTFKGRMD